MVTLVIPIYNMEQYLPICIASIQKQTCWKFEVILVDDGSTDSSGALCDGYAAAAPDQIRVIHKPNGGLSSARNAGIEAARGEWIVFPGPDDWVEPDYVETFLRLQQQFQAQLVCLGHYVDTDLDSKAVGANVEPYLIEGVDCQQSILLGPSFQGFSWNKLYRLDIIRTYGLQFLDEMGTTEDVYFTYQYLVYCDRIVHAPGERVYHYYQRDNSSTRSGYSTRKLETIRTYELIITDCKNRDPELARASADFICTTAVNLIWLLVNSNQRDSEAMAYLRSCIRRILPQYLGSEKYGAGRKFQAILALFSPHLYVLLKNLIHYRNGCLQRKWS